MTITHAAASAAILAHCDAGTIVQAQWHGIDGEGRAIACLLGAIDPNITSVEECNGDLMPMWLAYLTPVLFDGLLKDSVAPIARRYGNLVGRWHVLSSTAWELVLHDFLIYIIEDALDTARPLSQDKAYWPLIVDVCAQCKAAIKSEDKATRAHATSRAASASIAAARADAHAAASTYAALVAYAAAADARTSAAARAAAHVIAAARTDAHAIDAADAAAYAAAARLFTFLLDRIAAEMHAPA